MAGENKAPDKIWALRKSISRPNYAVLELLLIKSPRTTRELYAVLEKKFTRKTLILTLRELSLELNAIQPTHIRTDIGYSLGYRLNPKIKDVIIGVKKFSKIIENAGKV
jgi:hypothetical protein